MKVAIFSRYPKAYDEPRGGVESVTVVLTRALAEIDDLEIHLITLEPGLSSETTENDGKAHVHRLPSSGWPQIADVVMGPGRKRLLRKIRELKPDIVHSHETFGLNLGELDFPHVFTVHGFDHANLVAQSARFQWARSRLWKLVERRGLARQRDIISISPYVRKMIEPQTTARIHDIENPVDKRFFDVRREEGAGRALCVGWVDERKNTLGSVEAFAAAVERGCDGTLVIAGDAREPSYLDRVNAAMERRGVSSRVELLGHINHERLIQELARASVMLLPSLQENAPMAITEAMAVGVPVIASNRCGMPFIVEEGGSGFLIDPTNTDQIADRLTKILRSSRLREKMGRRGREIALARFHPDVVARKTMGVYVEITKDRKGPPGR